MNKKGFTLIELLAVIIILAILMIIAVPNILTTLQTAREQAFKTQAQSIYKAAEQQFIIDSMTGTGKTCYDSTSAKLNLGSIASSVYYKVQLNASGQVTSILAFDTAQKISASAGGGTAVVTQNDIALKSGTTGTNVATLSMSDCAGTTQPTAA